MAEEEEGNTSDEQELQWPTVDGSLGVHPDDAVKQARMFFYGGFFLLPWLWFLNCFYFSPVLRNRSQSHIRPYVVWSGIGFVVYTVIFLSWLLTYAIGGEKLLGKRLWNQLAVYNLADKISS